MVAERTKVRGRWRMFRMSQRSAVDETGELRGETSVGVRGTINSSEPVVGSGMRYGLGLEKSTVDCDTLSVLKLILLLAK